MSDVESSERHSAATVNGLETRNRELQRALQAANREIDSLSYSIAHDLRTPLLHIDGFAQLLGQSAKTVLDGESCGHLARIVQAARSMQERIEALLEYAKVSRTELVFAEIDLEDVLDAALAAVRLSTKGRSIQWQRTRLPRVFADAAMLLDVFVNLLANAVKYTRGRDPAIIEIGTRGESAGEVTVFVRDNGVGFDLKYASRLFSPFQRMHSTDLFQGAGMGLAKVQRIIVRHGGAVRVEAAVDQGATFFLSLPTGP
jgi:light-regulated signal transduction histidine kinase (bacteriophytochrome)